MKSLYILLACWLTFAQGGVLDWTEALQEEAEELYRRTCGKQPYGVEGPFSWHCKEDLSPQDTIEVSTTLPLNIPAIKEEQAIFIKPPDKKVKINVNAHGTAEFERKTRIFVLPQKIQTQLNAKGQVNTKVAPDKPRTLFLRDKNNNDGPGEYPPPSSASSSARAFDVGNFPGPPLIVPAQGNPYFEGRQHRHRNHRKRSHRNKDRTSTIPTTTTTTTEATPPPEDSTSSQEENEY